MNSAIKKRFHGFTLVELLVVIAIIGVLIGMLLPAVQSVREAARRTVCSNNMKQMGLAIHSHELAIGIFPDGGYHFRSSRTLINGRAASAPKQDWGWLYQILPFIEQDNLHQTSGNGDVQKTTIPFYFCPSRRASTVKGGRRAQTDYAGNGGHHNGRRFPWAEGKIGGVIVRARETLPVGFVEIEDGASNTIIAGEKALHPRYYNDFSCSDNEGWASGWDWDIIRWGNQPPISDWDANNCEQRFGSSHLVGSNFLFVDGSVHFLSNQVDEQGFKAATHRNDGIVNNLLN